MTWNINLGGHIEDRSQEQAVADVVRGIIPALKELGLSGANFHGNEHQENFLAPPASEPEGS